MQISELILQTFHHFTYVIAHSPTLLSLLLGHSSFSNPSVASPTSQLILQPFFRFSYVTGSSLTSYVEPPMLEGRGIERWFQGEIIICIVLRMKYQWGGGMGVKQNTGLFWSRYGVLCQFYASQFTLVCVTPFILLPHSRIEQHTFAFNDENQCPSGKNVIKIFLK